MWNLVYEKKLKLDDLLKILNSEIVSACIGALVGAGFAYWILTRQDKQTKLEQEIRSLNIAITLCWDVLNVHLEFKKIFLYDLVNKYQNDQIQYKKINEINKLQIVKTPFNIGDIPLLTAKKSTVQDLLLYVREKLDVNVKTLTLSIVLPRAVNDFNTANLERNTIVRNRCKEPNAAHWYFGVPDSNNISDNTYRDSLQKLKIHCDESIMFSRLLAANLEAYGNELRTKHKNKQIEIVKISLVDINDLKYLPLEKNYQQWI